MRLLTSNDPVNMVRLGLDMVAAGVVFGLVVLVVFAIARIGTAGRSRPPAGAADHRRGTGGPQSRATSDGRGKSARPATSQGHRQDRLRAGAPGAGSGHGGARSGRPSVLNPTNVYTPGGLLDVPRDGRAPGTPGGQFIPEILRTAGPPPAPGARAAGSAEPQGRQPQGRQPQERQAQECRRRERRPAGGTRTGHRPAGPEPSRRVLGYQPGVNPGGPGRAPYAPGGQPPPPMPPRDHMRPREAPRPGHAMPSREAPRPGHVGPPRDAAPPREGMPREAMGPGGPIRPGGPIPPRDPAYQRPPGQSPPGQRPPGQRAPGQSPPGQPPPGQGPHQYQGGGAGRQAGGARLRRSGRPQARIPGAPGTCGTCGSC